MQARWAGGSPACKGDSRLEWALWHLAMPLPTATPSSQPMQLRWDAAQVLQRGCCTGGALNAAAEGVLYGGYAEWCCRGGAIRGVR
jgi:hypothetical protein